MLPISLMFSQKKARSLKKKLKAKPDESVINKIESNLHKTKAETN